MAAEARLPELPAHLVELGAVGHLAGRLLQNMAEGTGGTVTWLNHYSALKSLRAGVPLEEFDYLGLDGIFLCRLVRSSAPRTSADLLLPVLLMRRRPCHRRNRAQRRENSPPHEQGAGQPGDCGLRAARLSGRSDAE